jgi:hypothetical protein
MDPSLLIATLGSNAIPDEMGQFYDADSILSAHYSVGWGSGQVWFDLGWLDI